MNKLPYIFDLMWDCKTIEQVALKKQRLEEAVQDLQLLNEALYAAGLREELDEVEVTS